jgi:predicted nucleic acid-binding protein
MRQKVFFDTNVLLDLLLPGRKSVCVMAILTAVKTHKFEGQITTQSMLDAKYSSRKQGVTFEAFKAFYEELRRFINFGEIDPTHLDWAFEHYSGDLEDDAQYASAYDACCDYFLTRDTQLQKRNSDLCPMTVITPEEFLSRMMA